MTMHLVFKLNLLFHVLQISKDFYTQKQARNNICEPVFLFHIKQIQRLISST